MPSALSVDLRERVIAAIETGTSRRQAAKWFGVGAASAIRWHDPFRQEGQIAPKLSGGDHGAPAIEAHAEGVSQTLAQGTEMAGPAALSDFVNLRKSETDRQQPVLLAHRPGARQAEPL